MRRFAAIAIALLLGMSVQAHAEYEALPPYIYYYSHRMAYTFSQLAAPGILSALRLD